MYEDTEWRGKEGTRDRKSVGKAMVHRTKLSTFASHEYPLHPPLLNLS